jgi:hypothetical protein
LPLDDDDTFVGEFCAEELDENSFLASLLESEPVEATDGGELNALLNADE